MRIGRAMVALAVLVAVAAPARAQRTPPRPGRAAVIGGFVTAGAGVIVLVTGASLLAVAEQAKNATPPRTSDADTNTAAGASLLAIGGAAIIAGAVVGILGLRARLQPRVALTSDSAAAGLQLRF